MGPIVFNLIFFLSLMTAKLEERYENKALMAKVDEEAEDKKVLLHFFLFNSSPSSATKCNDNKIYCRLRITSR